MVVSDTTIEIRHKLVLRKSVFFDRLEVCGCETGALDALPVPSHIVRDRKLVEMLQNGCFKEFVAPEPDSQAWVESILKEARALH
jgi:hypothetical protein